LVDATGLTPMRSVLKLKFFVGNNLHYFDSPGCILDEVPIEDFYFNESNYTPDSF